MQTTRTGQHYAAPRFKVWREDAALQVKAQVIHKHVKPVDYPVRLKVNYTAGDHRTRDVSGMLDALFHLLVYSAILKDDGLVRDVLWYWEGMDRKCPKVVMELTPCG